MSQNSTNSTETPLRLTPEGEAAASSLETSAPKVLTRKQIGQLRRYYLTKVHGRAKACGHLAKFGADKQPNNNCVDCWTAFFATYVDLMAVHKLLTEEGVRGIEKKFGTKFTRNFHGFLALYLKEQREA